MRYDGDERHQRRAALIREIGKTNRMETRRNYLVVLAVVLGVLALIGSTL